MRHPYLFDGGNHSLGAAVGAGNKAMCEMDGMVQSLIAAPFAWCSIRGSRIVVLSNEWVPRGIAVYHRAEILS